MDKNKLDNEFVELPKENNMSDEYTKNSEEYVIRDDEFQNKSKTNSFVEEKSNKRNSNTRHR